MGKHFEFKNRTIEIHIDKKKCSNCESSIYCEDERNFDENDNSVCDDWELDYSTFEKACDKLTEEDNRDISHPLSKYIIVEDD